MSGALLAAYFILDAQIIQTLTTLLEKVSGSLPALAVPKVIAVTLLTISLLATWWKVIQRDIRFHAPILITYILAVGDATAGILEYQYTSWPTILTGGRVITYSPTFIAINGLPAAAASSTTYGKDSARDGTTLMRPRASAARVGIGRSKRTASCKPFTTAKSR